MSYNNHPSDKLLNSFPSHSRPEWCVCDKGIGCLCKATYRKPPCCFPLGRRAKLPQPPIFYCQRPPTGNSWQLATVQQGYSRAAIPASTAQQKEAYRRKKNHLTGLSPGDNSAFTDGRPPERFQGLKEELQGPACGAIHRDLTPICKGNNEYTFARYKVYNLPRYKIAFQKHRGKQL